MFDRTSYLPLFTPPVTFLNFTDPSYCLPAFYKIFAEVEPADRQLWDKAYTAAQELLQRAANPQTGLVPDYADFDGTPVFAPGETPTDNAYTHNFQEDAWRAIANANVDAAWFGRKPWQTRHSDTPEAFFESQGVTTYPSRYHLLATTRASVGRCASGQPGAHRPLPTGDVSTQDVLNRYITAPGGTLKLIADFGNEQLKIA